MKIPKPLPIDICRRCIDVLQIQRLELELSYKKDLIKLHTLKPKLLNLDLEIVYYQSCIKKTERATNGHI